MDGALRGRTLLNIFTFVYTHLYLHIHTRKHVHLYYDVQNNEQMQKWMELFEVKRYYNILQYHWITRHNPTTSARDYYQDQLRAATTAQAGGATPVKKRGGLRSAAAKAKEVAVVQRLASPMRYNGGGSPVRGLNVDFIEWMQKSRGGGGGGSLESTLSSTGGRMFSRDQSSSSSMSVSSPPLSPNMCSHRAKDCLQPGSPTGSARSLHHTPHVSHTLPFMVQMQQGSMRLVPHTTRSQVRTYHSCMCD